MSVGDGFDAYKDKFGSVKKQFGTLHIQENLRLRNNGIRIWEEVWFERAIHDDLISPKG